MKACLKALTVKHIEAFFEGKAYPALVCAMALLGYFTGLELYFHIIGMAMLGVALSVSRSVRPLIAPLCSFILQISIEHTPALQNSGGVPSSYYFEGARGAAFVLSFVPVLFGLILCFIGNSIITRENLRSLPLALPSVLLCAAFLLGGAFSGVYEIANLGYSLVQIVVWFVIFYVFYLGLKRERADEILDYFIYVSSLVALVIIVQTLEIYCAGRAYIPGSGEINRSALVYGWGNCCTAAEAIMVLVPILLLGASRSRYHSWYFAVTHLALFSSILNVTRGVALVGIPIYAVSIVVCIICSKNKLRWLVSLVAVAVAFGAFAYVQWEYIWPPINNYIQRGFGDSGRIGIWNFGIDAFFKYPIFGMGFYGLSAATPGASSQIEFIPMMMHNTPIQMLACFGIVGAAAYSLYRIKSAMPFVLRPSFKKTMLGAAMLVLLLSSLLDNFVFYISPMFPYAIILAIVYKIYDEEKEEKCK